MCNIILKLCCMLYVLNIFYITNVCLPQRERERERIIYGVIYFSPPFLLTLAVGQATYSVL